MQNNGVTAVTTDFAGKLVSHLMRRNEAFGVGFAYGTAADVLHYHHQSTRDDNALVMTNSLARMFMDLINQKQVEVKQLTEGIETLDVTEQRTRYREIVDLGNDVVRLNNQLEELTNV